MKTYNMGFNVFIWNEKEIYLSFLLIKFYFFYYLLLNLWKNCITTIIQCIYVNIYVLQEIRILVCK